MSKYEMVELYSGKKIAKEFNRCKEDLKLFSEQTEKDLSLSRVDTDWFWGFGSHTVTGEELNRLTSQIQDYLIGFNNINNKIIKEFEAIYNTFNALDNEYIKNIVQSIMKSNEAINKANKGLIEAEKRIEDIKETNGKIKAAQDNIKVIQDKLQIAQQNIDRSIEIQKKVIEGLSQFKIKIDSYKHLKDIDNMWENLEKLVNETSIIYRDMRDIRTNVQKNMEELNIIKKFKEKLENYRYIENFEYIKNSLEQQQEKINILENNLKNNHTQNRLFSKKLNVIYFLSTGIIILTVFNIFYLFLKS